MGTKHSAFSDSKTRYFSDHDKLLFRAGVAEGEARLRLRLRLLETTNKRLWEQLCELDKLEPLVDVRATIAEAKMLMRALKAGNAHRAGKGALSRRRASKWLEQKIADAQIITGDLIPQMREREKE